MNLTKEASTLYNNYWPSQDPNLKDTDPELFALFQNFALGEVSNFGTIDEKTKTMVILTSTIATNSLTEFKAFVIAALNVGVTPVQLKEATYQAVPYLGFAKVIDFITVTNKILKKKGYSLPLEGQSTTTLENRFEKGLEVQKSVFGQRIEDMRKNAPDGQEHIQDYLSANCFGDYYTRNGLDLKTREMLTYAMLISMGGAESQVKGHIQGNLNEGNDKETMIAITTQLLPYIGYPRTLNAIKAINEVTSK